MPIDRFTTTFRVSAPPAAVYAHLLDPHNYVGLAPLVVEVRDIRTEGDDIRYVSIERFRLGPFHFDNPIDVTMTPVTPGRELVSKVRSPGNVRLTASVTLTPDGDDASVTEAVVLDSPWWIHWYATRKAREAQDFAVAQLKKAFGAGT